MEGTPGGDRTHNLLFRRQTLCPIELRAQLEGNYNLFISCIKWKYNYLVGTLISVESPELNDNLIRLLLPRLERISVDSYWAHRASGVRGALVKLLEQMESGLAVDPISLKTNLLIGFEILQEAAEEYT